MGLQLIAAYKFSQATVLVTASLAALRLVSARGAAMTEAWLDRLALVQGDRWITTVLERSLTFVHVSDPTRVRQVAIGALLYAAIFLVEGVGLARERRWAEYLTVGVTGSFLPVEVLALAQRWTIPRAVVLVLNVAVVWYLVRQLRMRKAAVPEPTHAVS